MIPTILVIEENTLNLELARDGLIRAGMKVVEALILLDIRLPGMDGIDTRTLAGRIRGLLDPGRSRRSAGGKAS